MIWLPSCLTSSQVPPEQLGFCVTACAWLHTAPTCSSTSHYNAAMRALCLFLPRNNTWNLFDRGHGRAWL